MWSGTPTNPSAEATFSAAARFAGLRELGPAFIAHDGDRVIVGALSPLPPAQCWGDVVHASTPGAGGFGTVGYLAWEAGQWVERIAVAGHSPLPPAWFGRCTAAWTRPLVPAPGDPGERWLGSGAAIHERSRVPLGRLPEATRTGGPPRWSPAGEYEEAVAATLASIREGDCYQVNLAREVQVDGPGDPLQAWLRLALRNPARRAMLLDTGEFSIVSNSPELLLAAEGRSILSVPIKGTRPADAPARALLHSAKERAELTMIVDLVRADLGRVARAGSVRAGPRRVGHVGHLWHAMQRVRAELDDGRRPVDALEALFPAGSVSGAPRIRATELIAKHERRARGVYCGTMGWFADDGSARWNVAIRTLVFEGPGASPARVTFHVGSGIVWGSEPQRERVETEWKAQQLIAAVCA